MKKIFILGALAAFALTSCSKESSDAIPEGATGIEFRGTIEKTRASLVGSKEEMASFFVEAYQTPNMAAGLAGINALGFMQAPVYLSGASWTYAPKKYYPTNGDMVNFYAYHPIKDINLTGLTAAAGVVSFTYTVPVKQDENNTSTDLLVSAALQNVSNGSSTTPVAFTFDHALSSATFSARNTNAAGSELVYTIESISLVGVDNTGKFTYNNLYDGGLTPAQLIGSWSDNTAIDQTYLAGINASGVAVTPVGTAGAWAKLLSDNDYMMVLPQDLTAGTLTNGLPTSPADGSFVAVKFSLRDGTGAYIYQNKVRYISLTHTFVMGKCYNFQIDFGPGTDGDLVPIELDVTDVNAWDDIDQTI